MSKTTKQLVEIVDDFNPQDVVNTAIGGLTDATGKINGKNTGYYKVTYENGKIVETEAMGKFVALADNKVYYAAGPYSVYGFYVNPNITGQAVYSVYAGLVDNKGQFAQNLTFARKAATSTVYATGANVNFVDTTAGVIYAGANNPYTVTYDNNGNASYNNVISTNGATSTRYENNKVTYSNTINLINTTASVIYAGGKGDDVLTGDVYVNLVNSNASAIYAGGTMGAYTIGDLIVTVSNEGNADAWGTNRAFYGAVYGAPADTLSDTFGSYTYVNVDDYTGAYYGGFNWVEKVTVQGDSNVNFYGYFNNVETLSVVGNAHATVYSGAVANYEFYLDSDSNGGSNAMLTIENFYMKPVNVTVVVDDSFAAYNDVNLISWSGYDYFYGDQKPTVTVINSNGGYVADYKYELGDDFTFTYTDAADVLAAEFVEAEYVTSGNTVVQKPNTGIFVSKNKTYGKADDDVVVDASYNVNGAIIDLGAGANTIDLGANNGNFELTVKNVSSNTVDASAFTGNVNIKDHNGVSDNTVIVGANVGAVNFNKTENATLIVEGNAGAVVDFSGTETAEVALTNGSSIFYGNITAGKAAVTISVDAYAEATLNGFNVSDYIKGQTTDLGTNGNAAATTTSYDKVWLEIGNNAVLNAGADKVVSTYNKNLLINAANNAKYYEIGGNFSSTVLIDGATFLLDNFGAVTGTFNAVNTNNVGTVLTNNSAVSINNYGTFAATVNMGAQDAVDAVNSYNLETLGGSVSLGGVLNLGGGADIMNIVGDQTVSAVINKFDGAGSSLAITISNGNVAYNGTFGYTHAGVNTADRTAPDAVKENANVTLNVSNATVTFSDLEGGAVRYFDALTISNSKINGAFDFGTLNLASGNITFEKDEVFTGDLTVAAAATLTAEALTAGNITVNGALTSKALTANGTLTVAGTAVVNAAAVNAAAANIGGAVNAASVEVAGALTVTGVGAITTAEVEGVRGDVTAASINQENPVPEFGDITAGKITATAGNINLDKVVADSVEAAGSVTILDADVEGAVNAGTDVSISNGEVGNVTGVDVTFGNVDAVAVEASGRFTANVEGTAGADNSQDISIYSITAASVALNVAKAAVADDPLTDAVETEAADTITVGAIVANGRENDLDTVEVDETIAGDVTIGGNGVVNAASVTAKGALNVTATLNVTEAVDVEGAATVTGTLTATGAVEAASINADALAGTVTAASIKTTAGNMNISNATVTGEGVAADAAVVDAAYDLNIGTANITGNVTAVHDVGINAGIVTGSITAGNDISLGVVTATGRVTGASVDMYGGSADGVQATAGNVTLTNADVITYGVTAAGDATINASDGYKASVGNVTAQNVTLNAAADSSITVGIVNATGAMVDTDADGVADTLVGGDVNITGAGSVKVTGINAAGAFNTNAQETVIENTFAAGSLTLNGNVDPAQRQIIEFQSGAAIDKITATGNNIGYATLKLGAALTDKANADGKKADITVNFNTGLEVIGTDADANVAVDANATLAGNSTLHLEKVDFNGTVAEAELATGATVVLKGATVDAIKFNGSTIKAVGEGNVVDSVTFGAALNITGDAETAVDAITFGSNIDNAAQDITINGVNVTVNDNNAETVDVINGNVIRIAAGTVTADVNAASGIDLNAATVEGNVVSANGISATDANVTGTVTATFVNATGNFTAGTVTADVVNAAAQNDTKDILDEEDNVIGTENIADEITITNFNGILNTSASGYETVKITTLDGAVSAADADVEIGKWTNENTEAILGKSVAITGQEADIVGNISATGDVTVTEAEGAEVVISGAISGEDITVNGAEVAGNITASGDITVDLVDGYTGTIVITGKDVTVDLGETTADNLNIQTQGDGSFSFAEGTTLGSQVKVEDNGDITASNRNLAGTVEYAGDYVGNITGSADVTIGGALFGAYDVDVTGFAAFTAANVAVKSLTVNGGTAGLLGEDFFAKEYYTVGAGNADKAAMNEVADVINTKYGAGFTFANVTATGVMVDTDADDVADTLVGGNVTVENLFVGSINANGKVTLKDYERTFATVDPVTLPFAPSYDAVAINPSVYDIIAGDLEAVNISGETVYHVNTDYIEDHADLAVRKYIEVVSGANVSAANVKVTGNFFGNLTATGDVVMEGTVAGWMKNTVGTESCTLTGKEYGTATIIAGTFKDSTADQEIWADITAWGYTDDPATLDVDEGTAADTDVITLNNKVNGSLRAEKGSVNAKEVTGNITAVEGNVVATYVTGNVSGADVIVSSVGTEDDTETLVNEFDAKDITATGKVTVGTAATDETAQVDGFVTGNITGAEVTVYGKVYGNIDATGNVTADTVGGYIDAEGNVTAGTVAGNVTGADVTVGSVGTEDDTETLVNEFDAKDITATGKVTVGTAATDEAAQVNGFVTGNITGASEVAVYGQVYGSIGIDDANRVGTVTHADTVNGSIWASGNVTAGNVTVNIDTTEGFVKADTVGGDIHATGDVTADSVGGSVEGATIKIGTEEVAGSVGGDVNGADVTVYGDVTGAVSASGDVIVTGTAGGATVESTNGGNEINFAKVTGDVEFTATGYNNVANFTKGIIADQVEVSVKEAIYDADKEGEGKAQYYAQATLKADGADINATQITLNGVDTIVEAGEDPQNVISEIILNAENITAGSITATAGKVTINANLTGALTGNAVEVVINGNFANTGSTITSADLTVKDGDVTGGAAISAKTFEASGDVTANITADTVSVGKDFTGKIVATKDVTIGGNATLQDVAGVAAISADTVTFTDNTTITLKSVPATIKATKVTFEGNLTLKGDGRLALKNAEDATLEAKVAGTEVVNETGKKATANIILTSETVKVSGTAGFNSVYVNANTNFEGTLTGTAINGGDIVNRVNFEANTVVGDIDLGDGVDIMNVFGEVTVGAISNVEKFFIASPDGKLKADSWLLEVDDILTIRYNDGVDGDFVAKGITFEDRANTTLKVGASGSEVDWTWQNINGNNYFAAAGAEIGASALEYDEVNDELKWTTIA